MAEWVRSLNFSALNHSIISQLWLVTGVGSSPALAIWATSKRMKQKCDIGGQISNQIDHNKFSIF